MKNKFVKETYDNNGEVLNGLMRYVKSHFNNLYLENQYVYYLVAHSFLTKQSYSLEQEIIEDGLFDEKGIVINSGSVDFNNLVKKSVEDKLGYYVEKTDLIDEFKQLNNYSETFGDIFNDAENVIPKSGLKLKQLEELQFIIKQFSDDDSNTKLYDVIDKLINWDTKISFKMDMICSVPDVNDLMAKLISSNYYEDFEKIGTIKNKPKVESIYDGFYGLGGSTAAVKKYIDGEELGQELNPEVYKLLKFKNLFGLKNVVNDNSLFNTDFFDKKFDIIVSEPPFGVKGRFNPQEKELLSKQGITGVNGYSEWIYVLSELNNLKDDGIMAMVLPLAPLSKGAADKKLRQDIIESNLLDAVIVLPPKLSMHTGISLCILVFKKNRDNDKLIFVDASESYDSGVKVNHLTNIDQIVKTYVTKEEINKFSSFISIDEIKENDFNLAINRYVDTFEGKNIDLDELKSKKQDLEDKLVELDLKIKELSFKLDI